MSEIVAFIRDVLDPELIRLREERAMLRVRLEAVERANAAARVQAETAIAAFVASWRPRRRVVEMAPRRRKGAGL